MHKFLSNNREELTKRCRIKVGQRSGRSATEKQLYDGIPLFLEQLIRTLEVEQTSTPWKSEQISGPVGGGIAFSEVSVSAAQHGKDLLDLGLTVDQVVHDYGDLCQSITDLAIERDAPFQVDEFRTLNRCLDNAISDAVTEFSFHRDAIKADTSALESNKRIGFFAHELRNQLGTASMAFSALQAGNLGLTGATGSILKRSLETLDRLITSAIEDVRAQGQSSIILNSFSLANFIAEIYAAASLSIGAHECSLRVPQVDPELAINGNRDLLMAAVANLLHNAFKFTQPHTEILLAAYATGDQVIIEVKDHCGGLGIGVAESMFLPFSQANINRTGLGLGLTIARQNVTANGGTLTVENLPSLGCVFKISLPRHSMPT